ncbi:hypothetical protein BZF66_05820 [Salmonella enterica]|nr:DNA condensation protein [Salmonella phage Munch]EAZ2022810.1 hypothetical protein [Salmonella enterica]MCP0435963.1 hypothetical protein [Salmonella enterica subsp. enterica serovar Mbandaka]EHX8550762.1 hypothetical protein [Salmonella enterica]ELL7856395.1 hypothetical protein [Salmonella enterica]
MIPFTRILEYGNKVAAPAKVIDFFLDSDNTAATMWMHLNNGELWGTCDKNYGYVLGFPVGVNYYGEMHLVKRDVKTAWGSTYGTFVLSNDDKLFYTGRQTIYDGTSNTATWVDKTSFYSTYFDILKIKKITMNYNTVYILLNDGSLYAHGKNDYGYFGSANKTPSFTPVLLKSSVQDCWITNINGVYQDLDGTFWGTGDNTYQQMQTTSQSTVYTTWTQLFSEATSEVDYEYNAFRISQTHFMLFRTDGKYYCSGRNYAGAWGIGNISVDANVRLYTAQLAFKPGNLLSLFGTSIQTYWTNILSDTNGVLYFAGYMDGGGGDRLLTFTPRYTVQGNGNTYRAYTNTRMFALCALNMSPLLYAKGSGLTTSAGVGFTPLSTPLSENFTLITDFNLREDNI